MSEQCIAADAETSSDAIERAEFSAANEAANCGCAAPEGSGEVLDEEDDACSLVMACVAHNIALSSGSR